MTAVQFDQDKGDSMILLQVFLPDQSITSMVLVPADDPHRLTWRIQETADALKKEVIRRYGDGA